MAKNDTVQIWEETVTIPTYKVGHPDKNPMFLEKQVYQGSSGVVYPLRQTEKARQDFETMLDTNPAHTGAIVHLDMIGWR